MRRNKGFTVIELLVVIAIIVVLMGMFFFGFHHVARASRGHSTRVTLASMKGLLTTYESQTRFGRVPPAWLWWEPASGGVVDMTSSTPPANANFWKFPYPEPSDNTIAQPLDAPGDVSDTPGATPSLNYRNA